MSWDEAAFKKAKMSSVAPDFDSKKASNGELKLSSESFPTLSSKGQAPS